MFKKKTKPEYFLLNIKNKARISVLTTPISHHSGSLSQYNKARKKKISGILTEMKEIQGSPLFTEGLTIRKS